MNISTFPPGAVVYCTLRYPIDKDVSYSSDGQDVLPTLKHSTDRGVEGQMDQSREGHHKYTLFTTLLYITTIQLLT